MLDLNLVKQFVMDNKDNILSDIKALVDIPSVAGELCEGAPAGMQVALALKAALGMADKIGLETKNCEGYMGYAHLKGESPRQLAIISHLDVVPAGNGWTSNPFDMQIRDGFIIGRGVADDKGAAVVALYAAKYFKENNIKLPYSLRLLFGTSEETDMLDVDYYLEHYESPAFCLTPDSDYPVCYGEKGITSGNFISKKITEGNIISLCGGVASNVVPDRAYAVIKADIAGLNPAEGIELCGENGNVKISAFGIGGHAAIPENTKNAIGVLISYILQNNLASQQEKEFLSFLQPVLNSYDGKVLGIDCCDGMFTPLTCIGGIISYENNIIKQNINIRYPTNTSYEDLKSKLSSAAEKAGAIFEMSADHAPMLIRPDSDIINTLVNAYNEITGKSKKPYTMGGGTYARHFEKAVAFGIEDSDVETPDFAGPMHGANEGMSIDLIMQSVEIYIVAIYRLMQLEL